MKTSELDSIKAKYKIVGRDERLDRAIDTALQVAPTDLSVLIEGESGVGKEVVPRIIHDYSPRKTKRYIAINCGSIPEGTIDSELFGHEKGSFTGALGEHDGYFAAANGGTLFLDEVGELPMSTQARLLRVLETGEYIRVGSNEPRKTNVRIVAATNVRLQQAIREGKFREDLYYRLCTISIKMPPLRDRGDDVVRLFKKFALDTAQKYSIPVPIRLNEEAEMVAMAYKWPGNIRQLRNLVEQMSILLRDDERNVTPQVLARYGIVPNGSSTDMATLNAGSDSQYDYNKERSIIFAMLNQLASDVKALKEGLRGGSGNAFAHSHLLEAPHASLPLVTGRTDVDVPLATGSSVDAYTPVTTGSSADGYGPMINGDAPAVSGIGGVRQVDSMRPIEGVHSPGPIHSDNHYVADVEAELVDDELDLNLAKMERKAIEEALRRNRNRRKMAAVDLGISERTLYRKIKEYGIDE